MGCSIGKHVQEAEWGPGVLILRVLPSVNTHKKFHFRGKERKKMAGASKKTKCWLLHFVFGNTLLVDEKLPSVRVPLDTL
jgi:hypothetical protein